VLAGKDRGAERECWGLSAWITSESANLFIYMGFKWSQYGKITKMHIEIL